MLYLCESQKQEVQYFIDSQRTDEVKSPEDSLAMLSQPAKPIIDEVLTSLLFNVLYVPVE